MKNTVKITEVSPSRKVPLWGMGRLWGLLLLALLAFSGCAQRQQEADGGTLKVISYNVYWGMRQDSTEGKSLFVDWIKAQDPDVLALQEMNGFTQKALEELAESYGHRYAHIVREPFADGSISFPVAITSKYPIVNVRRVVENNIHGFIEAEIEGLHFIVTHFHPFSAEKRVGEIGQILATIASKDPGMVKKWLLMGDLNSVSPLDRSEYADNRLRDFIREDRKKRPHNENLKDNELDYSIQQRILDFGLVDAFKARNPDFVASAPTKMFYDQSKFPLRYDYLYVSSAMEKDIVECTLVKDGFTDIYSDHYPVVMVLRHKSPYPPKGAQRPADR